MVIKKYSGSNKSHGVQFFLIIDKKENFGGNLETS